MRHFIAFVAGILLAGKTAGDVTAAENAPPADICTKFGNKFCDGARCELSPDEKKMFTCKCDNDNAYFDATKKSCEFKKSCATMECSVGQCKEGGPNQARCVCENKYDLTLDCKVKQSFVERCDRKNGIPVVDTYLPGGARCICGHWSVMNKDKTKCVPTTCLHPALSCKDLCEKELINKDPRCCEGWDQNNCSKAPPKDSYCSPGTIRKDGNCQDACEAGEAQLLCEKGCRKSQVPGRAYECKCNPVRVVAEDGIQCKVDYSRNICSEEEKQNCLPDQECVIRNKTAFCECPRDQHLIDGQCTGVCSQNKCHEDFTDCGVYNGKQECFCPWTHRKSSPRSGICTLNEYYYTVSFKPNISLYAPHCFIHEKRVLEAMQTTIGKEIFKVEILECTDYIKARLITDQQLSPYLLKKLQTCEYPEGDTCIIYPNLQILKGSATEIEEENLCDSLLKTQADATSDTNECVRDGDNFWFKCKSGFREVDRKTRGRLIRSMCEPGVSCVPRYQRICEKSGLICVVEDFQSVCKCPPSRIGKDGQCTSSATCTDEKKQECRNRGQECVVDNNQAFCKKKEDSTTATEATPVPTTCTEEKKQECENRDQECVVENNQAVCGKKADSTASTVSPPVPSTCTEEKKQECQNRGQECVVENNHAVCEKKGDLTASTVSPPGSGATTLTMSALFLLPILIPALYI